MQLVPRTSVVRKIEASDRAKWEGWAQAQEERGQFDMAQMTRDNLRKWSRRRARRERSWSVPSASVGSWS
jgi:hypothetical protein